MSNVPDLMKIVTAATYRAHYARAKATGTCIRCEKAAEAFRDASTRAEYEVSALCQQCQDECFRCWRALAK